MNINKLILSISVIACLIIIGVPTINKVVKNSNEKKIAVSEKYITEQAEKCYFDEKCDKDMITLKELYEKGYIKEKQLNPVTKEYYSEDDYVIVRKKDSSFHSN